MTDRSVVVRLSANVNGLTAGFAKAKASTLDYAKTAEKSATKHRQDWDRVGKGMLITGGLIAAGLTLAAKRSMEFEKQMSAVKAVSNATAKQMDQLRTAALKAGAATVFSAKDAAKAETELAKVGISTSDILGGALTGSLSLAAAGQIDLGDAATYSGQAMKIFGLQGKDVGHIADVLAAGANKSAADVGQLAQAMQQGGLVASQTGLHLEDTVGVLSAFADNALIGSDAGTSLKTMLQRLTPQSAQAAKLMNELGLNAYDASGQFVGMEQYAGMLQDRLKGMTDQQRNATLQTLFGSDAVRAANVLYKIGAQGVADYTNAVNDNGAAARTAATQMDNLAGDVENLKGSFETALIKSGSAGNDALRSITKTATGAINTFSGLPDPVQKATVYLAAAGSAALITGGALLTIVPKALAARNSLAELGVSANGTAAALSRVTLVAGTALAANAMGDWQGKARTATVETTKMAGALRELGETGKIGGAGLQGLSTEFGPLHNRVGDTSEALDRFGTSAYNALDKGWDARLGRWQSFGARTGAFNKQVEQLDAGLAQLVTDGHADAASAAFDRLTKAAVDQGVPLASVKARFTQYQAAIDNAAVSQKAGAASTADFDATVKRFAASTKAATFDVTGFDKALDSLFGRTYSVQEAADAYHRSLNALSASVKENGRSIEGNSDKAIANREALRASVKAGYDQVKAYADTGAGADKVAAKSRTLKAEFIEQARKAGYSKDAVAAYAKSFDRIPKVVKSKVEVTVGPALTAVGRLREQLARIHSKTISISVQTGTSNKLGSNPALNKADGGYLDPSLGSGPRADDVPIMASGGEFVVNAKSTAKHRSTIEAINADKFADGGLVGRKYVQHFAGGGFVAADWSRLTAGIPSSSPSRQDRTDAINRRARAVTALHKAEDALRKTRRDKHHTAREMARAEERLANARASVASATAKVKSVESARAAAAKPYATRFDKAADKANAATGAFLRNISTLRKRGYTVLADQLVMQADDDAYRLAAAAVKSTKTAKMLTADVKASVKNQTALDAAQQGVQDRAAGVGAAPKWSMPVWSAPTYGARPSKPEVQHVAVYIGGEKIAEQVYTEVNGQMVQVANGLIYGGP